MRHFSLVAGFYFIVAGTIAAGTAHVLHSRSTAFAPVASPAPKYLVLMVLDGARPDYFNTPKLPNLNALRASGTQFSNAFDGILEAETPSGHATIATGSRPDRDGVLGFDWANDNDRISMFDPAKMGALVQVIQESRVPTLAGLYKAQHPLAKVVALSGHKYYAAAPLGGPSADAIMYYEGDPNGKYIPVAVPGHVPPQGVLNAPGLTSPTIHVPDGGEDHLATQLALTSIEKVRPRMLLINYPEFDWPLGHVYGGNLNPSKVAVDMQELDTDLGRIEAAYRRAGILNQTLFVITADHGMMPVTRFIPSTVIDNAISQAGTTSPDTATSTADYIWLADLSKAQAVAQNVINAHDPGIQSVYYLTNAGGQQQYVSSNLTALSPALEAANQYLLGALLNGHEPAVVAFAKEGQTFSSTQNGWKADHGGNSWESQHIPLILSGTGIQRGVTSNAPAQLDDVAPTILADMGVNPKGMEGDVLTDALSTPSAAVQRIRQIEVKQLTPMASALVATSASETRP
jgi:predicted AlkP superfamily pyrophosphatase or phosphodiesterase